MSKKNIIFIIINAYRCIPLLFSFVIEDKEKTKIIMDLKRWGRIKKVDGNIYFLICYFMIFTKEFRNLYLFRIVDLKFMKYIIGFLFRPLDSLFLCSDYIGGGLFIQHGFSTIIGAKSIGENCWINQQVTVGYTNDTDCPIIGNNVYIYCGAKVLGDVTINDGSIVGAGAVVVKDVPKNSLAVGVPAKIIKYYEEGITHE